MELKKIIREKVKDLEELIKKDNLEEVKRLREKLKKDSPKLDELKLNYQVYDIENNNKGVVCGFGDKDSVNFKDKEGNANHNNCKNLILLWGKTNVRIEWDFEAERYGLKQIHWARITKDEDYHKVFRRVYIEDHLLTKKGITNEEKVKLEEESEKLKEEIKNMDFERSLYFGEDDEYEAPRWDELSGYAEYRENSGIDVEDVPTTLFLNGEKFYDVYEEYWDDKCNLEIEKTDKEDENWKNYIEVVSVSRGAGVSTIEFEIDGEFDPSKLTLYREHSVGTDNYVADLKVTYDGKEYEVDDDPEGGRSYGEITVYFEGVQVHNTDWS